MKIDESRVTLHPSNESRWPFMKKWISYCLSFSLNEKKRLTTSFFLLWCVITTILLPLWKKKFYKQISIELIIAEAQTILDIP